MEGRRRYELPNWAYLPTPNGTLGSICDVVMMANFVVTDDVQSDHKRQRR